MFDILIAIAAAGSIIAGIWDLLTTEVPDEVPALMISFGLFIQLISAGMTGDFYPLSVSLIVGTILLALGLVMYKKGQWGGADAWILAAIGYLVPLYNGNIFMIDYISNFLIISAAYMVIYAIIIGIRTPSLFVHFKNELRQKWKFAAAIIVGFALFLLIFANLIILSANRPLYIYNIDRLIWIYALVVFLTLFWVYGKVIEKYAFRKKIPASKLKVGDVLDTMLWRGLTKEEIKDIQKKKRYVTIKEGVRFVPTFAITLIITLLFGNLLFALLF
jgi:Flp pilus assembly protein protease CpaA